jgi:transcriptional regulator with XRE-family HTH domain
MPIIGHKLARLRAKRKLSQAELARLAEVDRPVVARLEKGVKANVKVDLAKRLADVLGCLVDDLL